MSSAAALKSKILRSANATDEAPDDIEIAVAQAFLDLENNVPDLKMELRALQFSAAKEVDVDVKGKGTRKAIVIFVPVPYLKAFQKLQQRFVVPSLNIGASMNSGLLYFPIG